MSLSSGARVRRLALGSAVAVAVGCSGADQGQGPVPVSAGTSSGAGTCVRSQTYGEGEILGSIYEGGVRTCNSFTITLSPVHTVGALPNFDGSLVSLTNDYNRDFGWGDPAAPSGGRCSTAANTDSSSRQTSLTNAYNGITGPEIHPGDTGNEDHCVRPGQYLFTVNGGEIGRASFLLDYVQTGGHAADADGQTVAIEATVPDRNGIESQDAQVNLDFGGVSSTITKSLEIDAVGADQLSSTFHDQTTWPGGVRGTALSWFRFGTYRSSSGWTNASGDILVRLFFDQQPDGSWSDGTGFFDPHSLGKTVRVKQFSNPRTATRTIAVGLEVRSPVELASGTATPLLGKSITLTRLNPDLVADYFGAPTAAGEGEQISISTIARAGTDVDVANGATAPMAVDTGWTWRVYLSADQTPSADDRVVYETRQHASITPGASVTLPGSLTAPWLGLTTPTTYYLIGKVDAGTAPTDPSGSELIELNEANNTKVSPIVLSPGVINQISSFMATACRMDAKQTAMQFDLRWTIQNPTATVRYEIRSATSTNPTTVPNVNTAAVLGTNLTGTTFTAGYFPKGNTYRWFWLRTVDGAQLGTWVETDQNPFPMSDCAL